MTPLLKPEQVAERLNIAPRTVRKLAKLRRIGVVRIGRMYRFRECDVERYVERLAKGAR